MREVHTKTQEQVFRERVEQARLLMPMDFLGARFEFDLNQGDIVTSQNLGEVWEVVKLARDSASRASPSGEHIALLDSVAVLDTLGSPAVFFRMPHLVDAARSPDKWISLRQLLEREGYDMNEIFPK